MERSQRCESVWLIALLGTIRKRPRPHGLDHGEGDAALREATGPDEHFVAEAIARR